MEKLPELRIFISSTFRDLHDEREHLGKKVFPEIRQVCHERGVQFTEIDLRWGLTKEDADGGRIIRTCLEEIDQCRPFFIGMLGDRYGWIPGAEEVNKDPDLYSLYPWMRRAVQEDHSVTEMEFYYGSLMEPDASDAAFFYFRTHGGAHSRDLYDKKRLGELKAKVRASGKPVFEFPSAQALGEKVRQDLLDTVERYWPLSSKPSWLEQQRREHEAFAASRRRTYISRKENLEKLDEHVVAGKPPVVVVADSGSGKSALLSYWSNAYRLAHPNLFIIEHYLGATSAGNDHHFMLRRIMSEIKERYTLEEEVPNDADQIAREFPIWLARVQKEHLLIVVDGLDQLEGTAANLHWLPTFIPINVSLILSTQDGAALTGLKTRKWDELAIHPLTKHERDELTVRFLAEFRKRLSREQRHHVANDEKSSSPLFLRTVLEELRLFGKFEELDEHIAYYLASSGMDDLFQRVLARMEGDYGAEIVREIMRFLWCAPQGLSEPELLAVTNIARADLSHLLIALEYHLVRLSGVLSFSHAYLRKAVETRYLQTAELQADYWRKLADYFETTEASQRKAQALPWLLRRANENDRLRATLSSLELFRYLGNEASKYELYAYWMHLGSEREIAKAYHESVAAWPDDKRLTKEYWETLLLLGEFFRDSGFYDDAEPFLSDAVEVWAELATSRDESLAHSMATLANIRIHRGDLNGAEPLLRQAIDIYKTLYGERNARTAKCMNDLVWLLQQRGDFAQAETLSIRAVELYGHIFGFNHPQTAHSLSHRAGLLRDLGKYDAAEELMRQVITIYETAYGPEYPDTAGSLNELGDLKKLRGDYAQAEELLRKALFILNTALGNVHPHVGTALTNVAVIMRSRGKLKEAESLLRRAAGISEIAYGPAHPQTATTWNALALVIRDERDYPQAEEIFRRVLNIYETALGVSHPHTAAALGNLANVLRLQDKLEEAEQLSRRALTIREGSLGAEHPSTGRTVYTLAQILKDEKKYSEAEKLFERALKIQQNSVGTEHPDTAATLHDLGELLISQGKFTEAEPLLGSSLAIRQKLLGDEHPETARTMALVAQICMNQGEHEKGRKFVEIAYAVQHRVLGAEHPDTKKLWAILDAGLKPKTGTAS